jgi:WD40 repeat protein/tRNA A-37 threonylcarbamoyl transferase component Bud32
VSAPSLSNLPPTQARRLDQVCNDFEAAWRGGGRPRVEDYLPAEESAERTALLHELVVLDAYYRRHSGEQPQAADYRTRFPDLDPVWLGEALSASDAGGRGAQPDAGRTDTSTGAATGVMAPVVPLRSFGDYQLLAEIAHGGMGIVYRARQVSLGRLVAIKMIRSGQLATPTERLRFRTEAQAAAHLDHPNIVPVYEVGEEQGQPYFSMKLIEGSSLAQVLSSGQWPVGSPEPARSAAKLIAMVARAVHHAHQRGILHRDLKPANILLSPLAAGGRGVGGEGFEPHVTDFGLAKRLEDDSRLTQSGALLGTPSYMAPEQASGTAELTTASDTYGLGAILYEGLTGRPPFQGATALETLQLVQHQEVPPPRLLCPQLPRDLDIICRKCLEKQPAQRYGDAAALADDLERWMRGEPIEARPVGPLERLGRWCRRRPAVAGLSLGMVLALVLGLAGVSWQWREAVQSAKAEATQRQRAEEAERQANAKLWDAYRAQAQAKRRTQAMGQRFESLAAIRKALELPLPPGRSLAELRNEAASALTLPDVEIVHEWEGSPEGTRILTFDATLDRYARSHEDGTVTVRRVADDGEVARLAGDGSETHGLLSPDGHCIAVYHPATLRLHVWRLTDAHPVLVHEDTEVSPVFVLAFSPDSRRLLYHRRDNRISVVTLAEGRVAHWPVKGTDIGTLGTWAGGTLFRPDGSQVMFRVRVDGQETLQVYDVDTGVVQANLPHPAQISWHAWHPGGRIIATCCEDHRIRLWDTASWHQTLSLGEHMGSGARCVFTPDGDQLLSNDWTNLLRVWDVATGRQLFTTPMSFEMHHFSPDGRLPVSTFAGPKVKLLRLVTGCEFRTLSRSTSAGPGAYIGHRNPAPLHPDGRLLAIMTESRTCALVDPISGAELAVLPGNSPLPLAFETSGALLTYGPDGLCRWPVRGDAATGRYHVGPPQLFFRSSVRDNHGSSADGRVLAIPQFSRGALLVHRDRPGPPLVLGPQEDVRHCAVSPDGRWVATGNHNNTQGVGAKVWDAASGQLVKDVRMSDAMCQVGFSPDGKWLMTTGGGCRLWAVGTWKEGPVIGSETSFTFSPDGRMLAVAGDGPVRLVDPASGREYVRLDAPERTRLRMQCFSPDGAHLIAFGDESRALHIWDLRRIRQQLAELGLDWDAPAYPPKSALVRKPLRLEVVR